MASQTSRQHSSTSNCTSKFDLSSPPMFPKIRNQNQVSLLASFGCTHAWSALYTACLCQTYRYINTSLNEALVQFQAPTVVLCRYIPSVPMEQFKCTQAMIVEGGFLKKPWPCPVATYQDRSFVVLAKNDRDLARAIGLDTLSRAPCKDVTAYSYLQHLRTSSLQTSSPTPWQILRLRG